MNWVPLPDLPLQPPQRPYRHIGEGISGPSTRMVRLFEADMRVTPPAETPACSGWHLVKDGTEPLQAALGFP